MFCYCNTQNLYFSPQLTFFEKMTKLRIYLVFPEIFG